MAIGRQAFHAALLLTCSMFPVTVFCPSAFSQEPPSVDNPQETRADAQQSGAKEQHQRSEEESAAGHEAAGEHQPRARVGAEAELAQPKAWLGIQLKEVSGDLAAYLGSTKGVLVESVFPDSPAEAAGIQVGDLIIAINGERVASPRALIEALLKLDGSQSTATDKEGRRERRRAERRRKEAEQQEDAAGKETEADRQEGKESETADDKAAFQPVKLTLLRQGKEITIEVQPAERPAALARPSAEGQAEPPNELTELEEMLRELETQAGARGFRFGPPTTPAGHAAGAERRIETVVIITKDASGQTTEVRIEREGDEPAKITVREGDQTHEITEDQIDQLPEKVRDAVKQALQQQAQARAGEHAQQGELRGHPRQRLEMNRRLREQLRELPGGHIAIISPEELRKMGQSAQELAAKYQKLAQDMAERGVQKAQDLTALPGEVKKLQAQVEELKKQLDDLQAQVRAGKE